MKPRIPITDKRFRYTDAASTDIRRTFAKARREQHRERVDALGLPDTATVLPLKVRR